MAVSALRCQLFQLIESRVCSLTWLQCARSNILIDDVLELINARYKTFTKKTELTAISCCINYSLEYDISNV